MEDHILLQYFKSKGSTITVEFLSFSRQIVSPHTLLKIVENTCISTMENL